MHIEHLDIATLSVTERIELAKKLWTSVREELEASPLTPDQAAEISRRVSELDAGLVQCEPFDAVMNRLAHR